MPSLSQRYTARYGEPSAKRLDSQRPSPPHSIRLIAVATLALYTVDSGDSCRALRLSPAQPEPSVAGRQGEGDANSFRVEYRVCEIT